MATLLAPGGKVVRYLEGVTFLPFQVTDKKLAIAVYVLIQCRMRLDTPR